MIATIAIATDMDTGRLITAAVVINNDLGVVCRRSLLGTWAPDYAVVRGGEAMPLPRCFALNEETIEALDILANIHDSQVKGD